MRLRISRAGAMEQLTLLLDSGYQVLAIIEDDFGRKAGGHWSPKDDLPDYDRRINDWLRRVLAALSAIFPTQLERNTFFYPTVKAFTVRSGYPASYETLHNKLRNHIAVLEGILRDGLGRYTDLPANERLY